MADGVAGALRRLQRPLGSGECLWGGRLRLGNSGASWVALPDGRGSLLHKYMEGSGEWIDVQEEGQNNARAPRLEEDII